MIRLALIRHAPTDYNAQGRMQGTRDVPLSTQGRAVAAGWRVPPDLAEFAWMSSPLARCCETARLMGFTQAVAEPRLVEMDWGQWEGRLIDDLRAELGAEMANNEADGLDFRPDGGESPRDVRDRVGKWAAGIGKAAQPTGAVAHQGIIRALLSLATGWEMVGKPPHKMDWTSLHLFEVAPDGVVGVSHLNISLENN